MGRPALDDLAEQMMRTDKPHHVVQTFDPQRLRIAREAVGLLQRELAEQIHVTAAAVSQYESGRARPSPDTLQQLAHRLGYPVAFFASDRPVDDAEAAGGFFRKLSRAPARLRRQALVQPLLLLDLVHAIEQYVRLPEVVIPRFDMTATATRFEVEATAQRVREAWQVPAGPIANVVRMLELQGVIVVRLKSGSDALDAFSCWFPEPEHPVVVLYSDKGDASRSRFDAAHELAHLILHRRSPGDAAWVEKQANWFAAAFLMPADDIRSQLPRTVSWANLIRLKLRWGVSIAALLKRAQTLGCLDQIQYERAMKAMSAQGWRKNEPSPVGKPEAPVLLERAVTLLEEEGVSLSVLANESKLPLESVREWVEAASDPRPTVVLDK